jgi:Zn-dependent peptidase ImmA (M78 family)/transcriptional regulator with XRE-family HTH domain
VFPANFRLLRLARESRRWSQTRLAGEAAISQAIVSRIESGLRPASDAELERLASALSYPTSFFLESDAPAAAPLFRKRAIRSASINRMIQARVNTAVLAARRILDAGVEIEAPFAFPEPGEIPSDDPLAASRILREAWRMPSGRVDSITATIEAAGGIVLHVDFGNDDASAACVSTLGDSRVWFLVNTREHAGDRIRLSLAHELGHAVMHRYLAVHDESRLEPEAYEFGVALTLPPEDFNRSVPADLTLRGARDLKRAYWISMQAIVRAASDRQLISSQRYTSLYKQFSARGWRRDEPEPIPIEQPTIWPMALDVHRSAHGYTDQDLADIARLTLDDLQSLFPRSFQPPLRLVGGSGSPRSRPRLDRAQPA